jgi:hypothetical protein
LPFCRAAPYSGDQGGETSSGPLGHGTIIARSGNRLAA